jgi:hypothetical protein
MVLCAGVFTHDIPLGFALIGLLAVAAIAGVRKVVFTICA